MSKRKIGARQVVSDLRAGMSDRDLMEKYNGPHKLDRGLRLRSLPWRCRTPGG